VQAIHPIRHTADGTALCRYCSKPTSHYTLFVCAERIRYRVCLASERERYDRKFLSDCGIAPLYDTPPARVTVEVVMQGATVRKARELHAMRTRKPLMGERRATACGEIDLGEIR
jgi:hypothetical protein